MSSLVSNEIFKTKIDINLFFLTIMLILNLFLIDKKFYLNREVINNEVFSKRRNSLHLIFKTYNFLSAEISIFLITYLLVVLIVAVKITSRKNLPLRRK